MKKILCLVLMLAFVMCSALASAEDLPVLSYADYAATVVEGDDEVAVCVETNVQDVQAWKDGKISVYAQNEEGAIFIYGMACPEEDAAKLVPGTKIRVKGFKKVWNGEAEIVDGVFEFVEGDSYIAEAEDMTDLLGTDELAVHQNEKVAFFGLKVAPSKVEGVEEEFAFLYNWNGSGDRESNSDLYFNAELDGKVYNFCVESDLCGNDTEVYQAVEALQIGDMIDVECYLYWYNEPNPHVIAVYPVETEEPAE